MTQPIDRPEPPPDVARWIADARAGSTAALGLLFQSCRQYLLLVANRQMPPDIQGKVGPSDLVQETFIKALDNFDRFQGHSEEELMAWLRRILVNTLIDATRHYQATGKRDPAREVALDADTGAAVGNPPPSPGPSPGAQAITREAAGQLGQVLGQLPELYRQVIYWRNWERLSFEDIGRRTGRSAEAARQLWRRALEQVEQILGPSHEQ